MRWISLNIEHGAIAHSSSRRMGERIRFEVGKRFGAKKGNITQAITEDIEL